jgi:hypothetical protein
LVFADVWGTLGKLGVSLLLRLALDDSNVSVVLAAVRALHALVHSDAGL